MERSGNGNNFSEIGLLPAKNGDYQHYNFTDATPGNGTNYYRLKQFGADNNSTYSAIVSIFVGAAPLIAIASNPVHNTLNIAGLDGSKIDISIINVSGKLFYRTHTSATQLVLNLSTLAKGAHYLLAEKEGKILALLEFIKE